MVSISETVLHDVVRDYPEFYRVVVYEFPYDPANLTRVDAELRRPSTVSSSLDRSIRRTRRTLRDYVDCNNFDLFVTFTFSPKKVVDRNDKKEIFKKMQDWLYRKHQCFPEFKYIIVPEQHKSGGWHFHALISGLSEELKKTNVIQSGNRIYNVRSFTFGFTNATYIEPTDYARAGNYISKYITKDLITTKSVRRYWCSKSLSKPTNYYNVMYDLYGLPESLTPLTLEQTNDFCSTFKVYKDKL